jgi:hypothetical protein
MKRTIATLVLTLASLAAHAAAVWNIDLSGPGDMTITGQFTTASADFKSPQPILSFVGTFSDDLEGGQPLTLVAVGQMVPAGYESTFTYDNLFFGPNGAWFDNDGLLLRAGLSTVNLYTDGGLIGYDFHDYFFQIAPLSGSITFEGWTSAVPEPSAFWPCLFGLGLTVRRRFSR